MVFVHAVQIRLARWIPSIPRAVLWYGLIAVGLLAGPTVAAGDAEYSNYAGIAEPNVKPAFLPLPPGAIEPRGWLRDWALAARNGITGHLDEQHPTFRDAWKGTPVNAPNLPGVFAAEGTGGPLEQCAYWFDGALRLGYLLHDDALVEKVTKRLKPVVEGVNRSGNSFIYWKKGKPDHVFNSWRISHMGRASWLGMPPPATNAFLTHWLPPIAAIRRPWAIWNSPPMSAGSAISTRCWKHIGSAATAVCSIARKPP